MIVPTARKLGLANRKVCGIIIPNSHDTLDAKQVTMMDYLAIVLALALACVAAMQFFYMAFLQAMMRQDKRRIEELETELRKARRELEATGRELELAEEQLAEALEQSDNDDAWPEIIDN